MSEDVVTIDPSDYRRVLGHFPTGVTVVTTLDGDRPVGVAIGSFASISLDPPLVGFFLGSTSGSLAAIEAGAGFCVNILGHEQLALCGAMASKSADKFDGVDWSPAPASGSPVLPGVVGVIDCHLDQVIELGDHKLIVGRVGHLDTIDADSGAMVFYRGQYGTFAG